MARYVLLVEGKDDQVVIGRLLEHYNIAKCVQNESLKKQDKVDLYNLVNKASDQQERILEIRDKEGVANVLKVLKVQFKESDLEILGILVDADEDLASRWKALSNLLKSAGYTNLPKVPEASGIIVNQPDKPLVGVWLMPNNELSGELEDFISFLIPDRDNEPRWLLAKKSVQEVIDVCPDELKQKLVENRSKAHIYTWLAWQEKPGKQLGQAITRRYLQAEAVHAQQLVGWLDRLFNSSISAAP